MQREAALTYRKTVINAWREVDDAMVAYTKIQEQLALDMDTVEQDQIALIAARDRFSAGAVDLLNVLTVQTMLLQAQTALAVSQQNNAMRLVTLFRALGGGWEAFETPDQPAGSGRDPNSQ
jgi:outer membrane protein TolC